MGHIEDVPVYSYPANGRDDQSMVDAVIIELVQLIDSYLLTQAAGAIDIKSLSLSENACQLLEKKLGRGEVTAVVSVSGDAEVYETSYSGVWWVKHKNREIAEHIEVGRVPAILCSHNEDIKLAKERLQQQISE